MLFLAKYLFLVSFTSLWNLALSSKNFNIKFTSQDFNMEPLSEECDTFPESDNYAFQPFLDPGLSSGIKLCVRDETKPVKNVSSYNDAEVYDMMLYQYVTQFPRTRLSPGPFSDNEETEEMICRDEYEKPARKFGNSSSCVVLTEYSYDPIEEKYKPKTMAGYSFRKGSKTGCNLKRVENKKFPKYPHLTLECNCFGKEEQDLCKVAVNTSKLLCGFNDNLLQNTNETTFDNDESIKLFHETCGVKYHGPVGAKITHNFSVDDNITGDEKLKIIYNTNEWCPGFRKSDENYTILCKSGDLCNYVWYQNHKEAIERNFTCERAGILTSRIQNSCYLYYNYDNGNVIALNEWVYHSVSEVNETDSNCTNLIATEIIPQNEDCAIFRYISDNSTLQFFRRCQCKGYKCDAQLYKNITLNSTLKDLFSCDNLSYVSEENYSHDAIETYRQEIKYGKRITEERGGVCYVEISDGSGDYQVNMTARPIKTIEDYKDNCGSSFMYSPNSYHNNDTEPVLKCCTILMNARQDDTNCTVDAMFQRWKNIKDTQYEKEKNPPRDRLTCYKNKLSEEYCPTTFLGCYRTRNLDSDASIEKPSGCTEIIEEKIFAGKPFIDYGLTCLTREARDKGRCAFVYSFHSSEPMLVCCCEDRKQIEKQENEQFYSYNCITKMKEQSPEMEKKVGIYKNKKKSQL